MSAQDYSTTPASNTSIDGVDVDENCAFSGLNNAIRSLMADFAQYMDDVGGAATSSGTDTVTLTTAQTITAYADGLKLMFIAGGTNTGAATLNVDSVGAKAIVKGDGSATALSAGDIVAGMPVCVIYDASVGAGSWLMLNPISGLQSTTYLSNVVEDTTPTLGGALDGGGFDITNLGTIKLVEQAAAEADTAGSGQFWVETATPNVPKFTDDAGNDATLVRSTDASQTEQADAVWEAGVGTTASIVAPDAIAAAIAALATAGLSAANQTEMEAATSNTVAATPGTMNFHPGTAKFWVCTTGGGTPSIATSHNVTSITDTGTGDLRVTIDTDFSSANWCASVCGLYAANQLTTYADSIAAGVIDCRAYDLGATPRDPVSWFVSGFGDQA